MIILINFRTVHTGWESWEVKWTDWLRKWGKLTRNASRNRRKTTRFWCLRREPRYLLIKLMKSRWVDKNHCNVAFYVLHSSCIKRGWNVSQPNWWNQGLVMKNLLSLYVVFNKFLMFEKLKYLLIKLMKLRFVC